jgi:hypothetical protein
MWIYQPLKNLFTLLQPIFPGAIWPSARSMHGLCDLHHNVDPSELITLRSWRSGYLNHFHSFTNKSLPFVNDPTFSLPLVETGVKSMFDSIDFTLNDMVEDDFSLHLALFGGFDVTQSILADVLIFDILTRTWHAPVNYNASSVPIMNRRNFAMWSIGALIMIQSGDNGDSLLPPVVAALRVRSFVNPYNFSFPWRQFQVDTSVWSKDYVEGVVGAGQVAPFMSLGQYLSMPAIIFESFSKSFLYSEPHMYTDFVPPNEVIPVFPATSAWATIQYSVGTPAVPMLSGALLFGGYGALAVDGVPTPIISSASPNLFRVEYGPICTTTKPVLGDLISYPLGVRQSISPRQNCLPCGAGSYANISADGKSAKCVICKPGSYSLRFGIVGGCTPCAAGFFSADYGGRALQSCNACPTGKYQDQKGQTTCKPCVKVSACSVAATNDGSKVADIVEVKNLVDIQPAALVKGDAEMNSISYFTLGATGGGFVVLTVLFVLFGKLFARVDFLYTTNHNAITKPQLPLLLRNRWVDLYINKWHTPMGGFLSVASVMLCCALTLILLLPIKYNNVLETRALVPAIVVDDKLKADMLAEYSVRLEVKGYGQTCISAVTGCV